ncbi:zinc finger protein 830 [Drosophila pseudoobscura]|uniref:Zinc finger protein 830 n=1 Tax=Drosophila pseudoobscura pseudoobscura TaxID=46245 RepID=A0A6I8UQ52_DROPS|nr:zinc finger protein 830 [Drosophila pseudoobscura]
MNSTLRNRSKKNQGDSLKPLGKVDSPLAKYNASGILTCIICRIAIKPSVWKVHVNSKQHKLNVDLTKKNTIKISPNKLSQQLLSTENSSTYKDKTPRKSEHSDSRICEPLPGKFFDLEKSNQSHQADLNEDEEWIRFQREIKLAATVSSTIVAEEQENINIKRQLKEIDEQIDNWKRFIKINDQKNSLINKERKVNKQALVQSDSSSSDEEYSVDDLYDWRTKNMHS